MAPKRPRLRPWLLAGVLLVGCGDDDKSTEDGDGTTDTGGDTTTDVCTGGFRAEPDPPAYTWTQQSMSVGSTTLRYHPTPSAAGLVVLFDGGGGSGIWFAQIEARYLVETLVDEGYAVMALESELPADEESDFDPTPDASNVDVQNLEVALSAMEALGVPTSPRYFIGFSGGGFFATLAARFVPANALALLNARGDEVTYDPSQFTPAPPTLWVLARNDHLVAPDDPVVDANQDALVAAGADFEELINEPSRAGDGAFTRIANPDTGVTEEDSADAVAQLRTEGYLDECDVPVERSAELDLTVIELGPSFIRPDFADEAKRQLDELYAAHAITSDFDDRIVEFFDGHP